MEQIFKFIAFSPCFKIYDAILTMVQNDKNNHTT